MRANTLLKYVKDLRVAARQGREDADTMEAYYDTEQRRLVLDYFFGKFLPKSKWKYTRGKLRASCPASLASAIRSVRWYMYDKAVADRVPGWNPKIKINIGSTTAWREKNEPPMVTLDCGYYSYSGGRLVRLACSLGLTVDWSEIETVRKELQRDLQLVSTVLGKNIIKDSKALDTAAKVIRLQDWE